MPSNSHSSHPDPTLERTFSGHKDVVTALAFSPNRKQLASASLDHAVLCYNFKPGMRAFKFVGHKGPVYSVDFHPSGSLLASASADQTVKLWVPTVQGSVTTFKAHLGAVRSVCFSSDGHNILTCSDDKSIKAWSTHRTRFQYALNGHLNWVRAAKFSPDDRLVLSGSDDKCVKLWDLSSRSCLHTFHEHKGIITSVSFHPSGHLIASASADRSINLWDIRTNKLLQHYADAHGNVPGVQGIVNSIAFGGLAGEWLLSTGGDSLVKVWDLQEGRLFYTLHGHKMAPTTAAVFSVDAAGGEMFASAGADPQIFLWRSNFIQIDDEENLNDAENTHDNRISSTFDKSMSKPSSEPVEISSTFAPPEPVNLTSSKHYASMSPQKRSQQHRSESPDETLPTAPTSTTIPDMAATLTQIVQQLDILTQTMSIIENRLTRLENYQAKKKGQI